MLSRQKKIKESARNSKTIAGQYTVPYSNISLSRYKHMDELDIERDDGEFITITASKSLVDLSVYPFTAEMSYIVKPGEEGRLDIIAFKTMGSAALWWAIAYRNGIYDPRDEEEVYVNKLLYIPTVESLTTFPNPLS